MKLRRKEMINRLFKTYSGTLSDFHQQWMDVVKNSPAQRIYPPHYDISKKEFEKVNKLRKDFYSRMT